jgi:SAM-dependent methyltransferase
MTLREAWAQQVTPDDYEVHMAAIGQAQANASLVRDLLQHIAIPAGSRVLIAGAGSGQMFDYISSEVFNPYRLLCSDISPRFLARLRERLNCETVLDDVEDSRLEPGFGVIILVLVLEHVDYRKALTSLSGLAPERFIIVIQVNPSSMTSALSPGRTMPGTMRVFAEETPPRLVPFNELSEELGKYGFHLERRQEVLVADDKKMIGLVFQK